MFCFKGSDDIRSLCQVVISLTIIIIIIIIIITNRSVHNKSTTFGSIQQISTIQT